MATGLFFCPTLWAQASPENSGLEQSTETDQENLSETAVENSEKSQNQEQKEHKPSIWFEIEPDLYYANAGIYIGLRGESPENLGKIKEWRVYKHLWRSSLIPSFIVLEGSIYPMPLLGVGMKKFANNAYNKTEVVPEVNVIDIVTSGFAEPWAFSLFLGNIVYFSSEKQDRSKENMGIMGFVFSASTYHIYKNTLIKDPWLEIEWKIKGNRKFSTHSLSWNFRIGTRLHSHPEIKDDLFIGVKRSRIDYKGPVFSLFYNSGVEYLFNFDIIRLKFLRHYLLFDKKWPVYKKIAFSLGMGVLWENADKYTGSLQQNNTENSWQFLVRPNVNF